MSDRRTIQPPVRGRDDARTAPQCLIEGNARYQSGVLEHSGRVAERRSDTAEERRPIAVILGCSDSRVPPQLILDQGPGGPLHHAGGGPCRDRYGHFPAGPRTVTWPPRSVRSMPGLNPGES